MTIQEQLWELRDEAYARFQSRLIPGLDEEHVIGVRVPLARKLAQKVSKEPDCPVFLQELPHRFYDENILHALLLSRTADYDTCIREVERFLPYVDNWAVCDILSPKVFAKHKPELAGKIREWIFSDAPFTSRFGMEMLMTHFLDKDFDAELLELPAKVRSEHYYVRMMIAWFYATALAKQWEATLPVLTEHRLDDWTHNKTIQKARESFRIPEDRKEFLLSQKT